MLTNKKSAVLVSEVSFLIFIIQNLSAAIVVTYNEQFNE